MNKSVRSYLDLCKIRIALLSAFSAAAGFLLSAGGGRPQIWSVTAGVFFLACGSLALNQYLERDVDAVMPRTCGRPIPSGRIGPLHALGAAFPFLVAGFGILSLAGSLVACALGLFALVWYNGVYTFLKRVSAFAAVPGALAGAVPPVIGWFAGGGAVGDPRLPALGLFFFLWQVSHSWLLDAHYGREYEEAGVPCITQVFSLPQLQRIIGSWICATAVSCLFLSAMGLVRHPVTSLLLVLVSAWLAWSGMKPLFRSGGSAPILVFRKTNYYLAAVLLFLSADAFVRVS